MHQISQLQLKILLNSIDVSFLCIGFNFLKLIKLIVLLLFIYLMSYYETC